MTTPQAAPARLVTPERQAQPVLGLLGFVRVLRAAGVAADAGRGLAFVTAVSHLGAASTQQLYWAGRITLCSQPDDLPSYDAAFLAWFGAATTTWSAASEDVVSVPRVSASLTGPAPEPAAAPEEAEPLSTAASAEEVLRHKDFSELSAAEREHLRSLLAALRYRPATRRAVRRRPARRGRVDPRATVRAMLQAGGEVVRPSVHRRSRRPRRLVLLVDVSGSMTPYADALLRFAHVLTAAAPATVETFTLGTRLTRLTRALRHRDAEMALRLAAAAVPDYAGGTRLGETLKAYTDRWGQRGMARGAVVVVFSDGWERGGADLLGEQVGRLSRLARAVVWVNPHVGRAGYEPVQSGIVAALPHLYQLVSGHSLEALDELLEVVAGA